MIFEHFHEVEKGHATCKYCDALQKNNDKRRRYDHILRCQQTPSHVYATVLKSFHAIYQPQAPLPNHQLMRHTLTTDGNATSESLKRNLPSFPEESTQQKQTKMVQSSIKPFADRLAPSEEEALHRSLCLMIFSSGLPFNIVENEDFCKWIKLLRPAYRLPNRYEVANRYLQLVYKEMRDEMIQALQALASQSIRVTLTTNGWTNVNGESIMNFMLNAPDGRSWFYRSVVCGTASHTAEYIASQLLLVIEELGPNNFAAICSDSAANMLSANRIVSARYPHIIGIGCTAHQTNLMVKDVLCLPSFKTVTHSAVAVIKYFKNSHVQSAHLKLLQKTNNALTLKVPVETRWQSHHNCFAALLSSRGAIEETIVKIRDSIVLRNKTAITKYDEIRKIVLDEGFWTTLTHAHQAIQPFMQILTSQESSTPKLSQFYSSLVWLRSKFTENVEDLAIEPSAMRYSADCRKTI